MIPNLNISRREIKMLLERNLCCVCEQPTGKFHHYFCDKHVAAWLTSPESELEYTAKDPHFHQWAFVNRYRKIIYQRQCLCGQVRSEFDYLCDECRAGFQEALNG